MYILSETWVDREFTEEDFNQFVQCQLTKLRVRKAARKTRAKQKMQCQQQGERIDNMDVGAIAKSEKEGEMELEDDDSEPAGQ